MECFIRERLNVNAEVKYAKNLEIRNMILAKIGTFEEKIEIMGRKKILGAEKIYIEDDKTKKKREIQRVVKWRVAKEEKEKAKKADVKIGHWKMTVNGRVYKWNKNRERLEAQNFRKKNVANNERKK